MAKRIRNSNKTTNNNHTIAPQINVNVNNSNNTDLRHDQGVSTKINSFLWGVITTVPRLASNLFSRMINRTFRLNTKRAGAYNRNDVGTIRFPILVTESIDKSLLDKICAYLQVEKAENLRVFFYNHKLTLGYADEKLAKEFESNFYRENVNSISYNLHSTKPISEFNKYVGSDDDTLHNKDVYKNQAKLPSKELMPIAPTMIKIDASKNFSNEPIRQLLGIRVIPHFVPFNELKVGFKYGIMNNRLIFRFIKLFNGDLSLGDFFSRKDEAALNEYLTKISVGGKSWNKALKKSSQAVSLLLSKDEFDEICNHIVDLNEPAKFRHFQKDIGYLDIIIIDKVKKEFIRINESNNCRAVHHSIRDILNSSDKDIVLKTTIKASDFHDEGL